MKKTESISTSIGFADSSLNEYRRFDTRHVVDRMQSSGLGTPAGGNGPGRSFPPNLIDDVLRNGTTRTVTVNGVTRTIHSSGTAEVVTEQGGRIVVTVNPFRDN